MQRKFPTPKFPTLQNGFDCLRSVRLWLLDGGAETGDGVRDVAQFQHSDEVLCLALTSDSRYLVTGSKDCSLKIWDLHNRKLVQVRFYDQPVELLAITCHLHRV